MAYKRLFASRLQVSFTGKLYKIDNVKFLTATGLRSKLILRDFHLTWKIRRLNSKN